MKFVDASGKLLLQSAGFESPKDAGQLVRTLQSGDASLAGLTLGDGASAESAKAALQQLREAA